MGGIKMLNQLVLVGRIADIEKNDDSEKATITLAVPRYYKNDNGEYDTDNIRVEVLGQVAIKANDYCNIGQLIGCKGRIENLDNNLIVKGEKLTFLSSTRKDNDGD